MINRRFSKLDPRAEEGLKNKNKELALDEKLREMHNRPLVKMFKFFNSPEMLAVATAEFDEVKFIEMSRVQLAEYNEKLIAAYDFSKQLQFG